MSRTVETMSVEQLFLNLWWTILYSQSSHSKNITLRLRNRSNTRNSNSLTHFYTSHFTRWLSLYILLPGSIVIPRHFIGFDKYLKLYFILFTTLSLIKLQKWHFLFHTLQKNNGNVHILILNATGESSVFIRNYTIMFWIWESYPDRYLTILTIRHDTQTPVCRTFF